MLEVMNPGDLGENIRTSGVAPLDLPTDAVLSIGRQSAPQDHGSTPAQR